MTLPLFGPIVAGSAPAVAMCDSVMDYVQLYPLAVVTASSSLPGFGVARVIDARRQWTYLQFANAGADPLGNWVQSDLGASGERPVNYLWIDRGHNLWGKTVIVEGGSDGALFPASKTFVVPPIGTVGGDPSLGFCATIEGALYTFFADMAPRRCWRVRLPYVAAFVGVIPGLMLGQRDQLWTFSSIYDDDARDRKEITAESEAGWVATWTSEPWRVWELDLRVIGQAEYDAVITKLGERLFDRNQPAAAVMNWVRAPEKCWLFQLRGAQWRFPMQRVTRSGRIQLREIGHRITR